MTLDQSTSDNLVKSTESELELKPQELTKKTEINKIYLFIIKFEMFSFYQKTPYIKTRTVITINEFILKDFDVEKSIPFKSIAFS